MKFVFRTQTNRTASYSGPSGINYNITKGEPFKVDNKLDIAFFKKNTRFDKAGLFDKKTEDIPPEQIFAEKLSKIEGISATTIGKIVKLYRSYEELEEEVMQNYKLDTSIPSKQAEILIKTFKGE